MRPAPAHLSPPQRPRACLPVPACPAPGSIELVRHNGRRLRRFGLRECDGGPHEVRGVRRSNLLVGWRAGGRRGWDGGSSWQQALPALKALVVERLPSCWPPSAAALPKQAHRPAEASRPGLCAAPQAALASQLPSGSLAFGAPVSAAEATSAGAAVTLASGQRLECLAVVGTDGARSAMAAAAGRPLPNYCGQSAVRGVARFGGGLPPELRADCIRQVWGPAARAGMYPISGVCAFYKCRVWWWKSMRLWQPVLLTWLASPSCCWHLPQLLPLPIQPLPRPPPPACPPLLWPGRQRALLVCVPECSGRCHRSRHARGVAAGGAGCCGGLVVGPAAGGGGHAAGGPQQEPAGGQVRAGWMGGGGQRIGGLQRPAGCWALWAWLL